MTPRRYWQAVLAAAVVTSTAGNVFHACLTAPIALRTPAAFAAALPPLALLAVTHGLTSSAGAGVRRKVYRWAVAGAVGIAALAFALSYAALRDLAIQLGQPRITAAGWPLLADLTIAVSSLMLLAVRPDAPADTLLHQPDVPVPAAATAPVPAPAAPAADVAAVASADAAGVLHLVQGDAPGDAPAERVMHQARLLVHQGVTRLDVPVVADVLARSAAGASQRSIGRELRVDPRTVANILDAVEEPTG
jgi:hypothetical protein